MLDLLGVVGVLSPVTSLPQSMKLGVFDVLPAGSLEGLTAEDLRLLLNGVGDINVQTLISYTSFNDESGEGGDKVQRFKRWFWSIVEKMNNVERQDLVRAEPFLLPLSQTTCASAHARQDHSALKRVSHMSVVVFTLKCVCATMITDGFQPQTYAGVAHGVAEGPGDGGGEGVKAFCTGLQGIASLCKVNVLCQVGVPLYTQFVDELTSANFPRFLQNSHTRTFCISPAGCPPRCPCPHPMALHAHLTHTHAHFHGRCTSGRRRPRCPRPRRGSSRCRASRCGRRTTRISRRPTRASRVSTSRSTPPNRSSGLNFYSPSRRRASASCDGSALCGTDDVSGWDVMLSQQQ